MPEREFNSNTPDEIALLDASIHGDFPTVRRMLTDGLDPNTTDMREDPWNVTPLMHAAGRGHKEVVKELLAAKARVNLTDRSSPGEGGGETALHYAAASGRLAVAELLLQAKADINKVSRFGRTPLTVAVLEQQEGMVQFLLKQGANPNLSDKSNGDGPLHEAASMGLVKIVALLLEYGANIDAKNSGGRTPFMRAAACPNSKAAFFLIEREADLKSTDVNRITCLMEAVLSENVKLVVEVLKQRVSVNAVNIDGRSALDFAILHELQEIQALLRKAGAKTGSELYPPKRFLVAKVDFIIYSV